MAPMSIRPTIDRLRAIAAGTAMTWIVAACGFTVLGQPPPIPVGPVGPVVANPNGGPPVECRGMPIDECQQFAADVGRQDVVRVIVTCTTVCTATEGEYRLDLLLANGRIEQAGSGSWMSAPAEPAPVPGETLSIESG